MKDRWIDFTDSTHHEMFFESQGLPWLEDGWIETLCRANMDGGEDAEGNGST